MGRITVLGGLTFELLGYRQPPGQLLRSQALSHLRRR
jgi:hypothetical protein